MCNAIVLIGCLNHGPTEGTISKSDQAAVLMAIENFAPNFTVMTFDPDEVALQYAKAAGARSVGIVRDAASLTFDVLLLGSGALQHCSDWYAGWWAEQHQAALAFEVLSISRQGQQLNAIRDLGRGNQEVLLLSLPAVLTVSSLAPARYVSHYRRWKAGSVDLPMDDKGYDPDPLAKRAGMWGAVRPRVRLGRQSHVATTVNERLSNVFDISPQADQHCKTAYDTDPAICAQQILRYLIHHDLIAKEWLVDAAEMVRASEVDISSPVDHAAPFLSEHTDANDPVLLPKIARGPRSLTRTETGIARRPRLWMPRGTVSQEFMSGKLLRKPRPLGVSRPRGARGPVPLVSSV